ncbi:M3EW, histidine kinase-group I protein [Rhexocercosporidium sp. MPI-PUGE-AT-0058]|nr:M3EW, histidine kinase-group I protein [Rhexocercosporidium sp. MPI-PUGE-AT-0058]
MEVQPPLPQRDSETISRDMRESQRALELRKFFAPNSFANTSNERDFNENLNNDGALDAYAETIVWRLNGVHAMVSLIDRGTQYFLAGCIRPSGQDDCVMTTEEWFSCSTVPVPGGLCENTLAVDLKKEDYPCFIVNDLSQDERFAHLPVVDGTMASYRFYAGTPITTTNSVSIGSFFMFDDRPRPHGLLLHEKQFMHQQAANVMKHLETKREASERRRVALMSQGIAKFLERDTRHAAVPITPASASQESSSEHPVSNREKRSDSGTSGQENSKSDSDRPEEAPEGSVLDKIRITLDQAADILRESLEITAGGVVFLDTAVGYSEIENTDAYTDKNTKIGATVNEYAKHEERFEANGRQTSLQEDDILAKKLSKRTTRRSSDKYRASKVLAMSSAGEASLDSDGHILDTKTLQSFVASYPKGNMWYLDEEGYFSSLEQMSKLEPTPSISPSGRRKSVDVTQQRAEANVLSRIFHKARQIIFLPLWDAGGDRWYSGCFVWSQSAVPVFTIDSEISYLSAFTNSLMVEISRLDAITSNKMKSDFISSISHEFRSPLHGILASAEFLRELEPSATQVELISTIQNCGGTLLDTINHVLDYSKINSFETSGNQQGTISNELYQMTNLALLCEDLVNGMIAAKEYRGTVDTSPGISNGTMSQVARQQNQDQQNPLEIILDIEHRDWEYNVQPGAVRRVVMNIFGNAQKYTESGYIFVQLRMIKAPDSTTEMVSLRIRDTGRGMSSEYMERKLYHPFAQEDTFAPGVGLGLSIVWSIINQLGGKISIRSELGKGTDVEITLPVEKAEVNLQHFRHSDLIKLSQEAEECISAICSRAVGKSVSFSRTKSAGSSQQDVAWDCIKRYCSEWFGFEVKSTGASILIADSEAGLDVSESQGVLIVHDQMLPPTKRNGSRHKTRAIENISQPLGPFRLARSLLALMDHDKSVRPVMQETRQDSNRSDNSTQTPLGSPEERAILDGIIATEYSFKPTTTTMNTDVSPHTRSTAEASMQTEHTGQRFSELESQPKMTLKLPSSRNTSQSPASTTPTPPETTTINIPLRPKRVNQPSPTTSLHILAVDDNDLNLQLIQRYLHKRKSDIIATARNGIEAVEAVRRAGCEDGFDVIFMDISMPEMNGFEATRLIRAYERNQSTPGSNSNGVSQGDVNGDDNYKSSSDGTSAVVAKQRAYIVALTGLASRRDRDEAKESGFDDFLTKPISFGKIGELLKRLTKEKADSIIDSNSDSGLGLGSGVDGNVKDGEKL